LFLVLLNGLIEQAFLSGSQGEERLILQLAKLCVSVNKLSRWLFLRMQVLGCVQLTVVAKVYWGDAKEKICAAVVEIPLDGLIMGSRGFGTFKRYSSTLLLCEWLTSKMRA